VTQPSSVLLLLLLLLLVMMMMTSMMTQCRGDMMSHSWQCDVIVMAV